MKLFTAIKSTTFCDPVAFGEYCPELSDPNGWKDSKGNGVIHQKHVRSRAYICFLGVPIYMVRRQDVFLRWYKFWDLEPMYLGPEVKEPGQYLLQLKKEKDSISMLQEGHNGNI